MENIRGESREVRRRRGRTLALALPVLAILPLEVLPGTGRAQQVAPTGALVFDGVTVVDVEQGKLVPGQRVVIVGNRIQAVGGAAAVKIPNAAQVVDARGKYLIPGLWDMHNHWKGAYYPQFIAAGVTGIRSADGPSVDSAMRRRQEVLAGTSVGPREIIAGNKLGAWPKVATPDEARRLVDSLKTAGAEHIKIHEVPREIYFAIAAEARRVGIPFGGHAEGKDSEISVLEASDSGASIIDHTYGCMVMHTPSPTVEECRPVAERLRRNHTWWVPTLVVYQQWDVTDRFWVTPRYGPAFQTHAGRMKEWWADSTYDSLVASAVAVSGDGPGLLSLTQEAGVPTLAGTDTFGKPGFDLHLELAIYAAEGLTPLEALQTATLNPAKYLRGTDSLGTVAAGKLADLVLLDADPLTEISNTLAIRAVVANGRYFDRAALDAMMAEVLAKSKSAKKGGSFLPKPKSNP